MLRDVSEVIEILHGSSWRGPFAKGEIPPIEALESGKVLYFPELAFELTADERKFLSPEWVDPKAKNISFSIANGKVRHAVGDEAALAAITAMMRRYYERAIALIETVLPSYRNALSAGRTSFRPVEVSGRKSSPRKDDTRLHVDAFPTSPVADTRIMRVFSNVNPDGKPRYWRLGDRFDRTAEHFVPKLKAPLPGAALIMQAVGLTKGRRTAYDHLMLGMHDAMKLDANYQREAVQTDFKFPPGSSWIVYTDQVPHASMAGQYVFEQTFHLPVEAMIDESKAPLRVLERLTGRPLV